MNRIVFLLLALLFQSFLANAIEGKEEPRLRGVVNINTKGHKASISLSYYIPAADSAYSSLRFYLSSDARIEKIQSEQIKSFSRDTSTNLPSIVIYFNQPSSSKELIRIDFEYEIPLDSLNLSKYGFVELGLDWFWFPIHPKMSEWSFKFDLFVKSDDHAYKLFSNGKVEPVEPGSYAVTSLYPDFDMDLFLMKDPKIFTDSDQIIRVVGSANNPLLKDSIVTLTKKYLDYYKTLYKDEIKQLTCIIRPIVNDPNGFGYARKGYFVLSEPSRLSQLRFYIAHELAHFWWLNGEPTENAWVTESFAEYNALLLIKHFEGDSVYNSIIREKYDRVELMRKDKRDVPFVYKSGTKNKTTFSHITLYLKGALVLHELAQKIGEKKMLEILKKGGDKKIATTEEFLELVRKQTNKTIANEVLERIKTF